MVFASQRHAIDVTLIQREYLLPEGAIGSVETQMGQRVDLRDVVARGTIPSRHVILDVAKFFRLRNPEAASFLMLVEKGAAVEAGQPLAGQTPDKGKRLFSPVTGIVAYIGNGRIILQEMPEILDLQAGVQGQVIGVQAGRGVTIETVGALVQGVWGNNRRVIGSLRIEPSDGLESIFGDQLNMEYRGAIVVTRRPLKATGLMILIDQGIAGLIAPSMDADLRDAALSAETGIILTEGFGSMRMGNTVASLLESLNGRQATLDATMPDRLDKRRPEVIVNISVRPEARPNVPDAAQTLRKGSVVRLTSEPYVGFAGHILDLPKTPVLIDNGLRVPCAKVELLTGEQINVPVANLELFGKA
jgi:hypothetical protein